MIAREGIAEDLEMKEEGNIESMNRSMSQTQFNSQEEGEPNLVEEEAALMEELILKKQIQENIRLKSEQVYDNLRLLIYKSNILNTQPKI